MKKTAVVILNYNGALFLRQFLPMLIHQTPEADLIVADNASTDDSESATQAFPQVTWFPLVQNFGYAGGYNEALKQLPNEYFMLLNSDVEVTENWLTPLEAFLDNHPEYVAVQPKIKAFHQRSHFEYAGACGGFLDKLGYPYCRGRIFDTLEQDTGQYDTPIDVHWTSGACMLIRADAFRQAGGFDADFFAHMEEIDLCWRLRSMGLKLACQPQSTVFHVGGGTLQKSSPRKTYLNFRNGLFLLIKNVPLTQILWLLPIRVALDLAAALKLGWEEGRGHFGAILKAQRTALVQVPVYWRKRTRTSNSPKTPMILWQYFFLNKKTFHDLPQPTPPNQ